MLESGKPILTLTDKAADHVRELVERGGEGVIGIRVGIKTAGCSGMKYDVEYATELRDFEDTIEAKGVTVIVDPAAVMFLVGAEMDWKEDRFTSGFVFSNPNEISRCGCGESFSVA